jgi:putative iron-regulated protein
MIPGFKNNIVKRKLSLLMNVKRLKFYRVVLVLAVAFFFFGCKKNTSVPSSPSTVNASSVLVTEASVVFGPTYGALANDAGLLYNGAVQFQASPTQQNLANCRQLWLTATADYEQSSASLFGPNGSIGADPASLINTYPIDTGGINSLLSSLSGTQSSEDSIIAAEPSYLIGFHGMEFELYGINGNKQASQFTPQQLAYITAVALNIKTLTWQVDSEWTGPFYNQFVYAGDGSTTYLDQRAAFADLVMGIANITETDGIYKMNAILANKSTILQESPFANNSVNDISNNLIGVQNIYYGQYGNNKGTGLSAFVSQSDVALDVKIKTDITNAIKAVGAITMPLNQAIYSQTSQMTAAVNACDSVDDDLKNGLLLYMYNNTK